MKVILLKDVAKVGQHGAVKEVSDGYGLNFLIARGLAVQATPEKIAAHATAQKREEEAREEATKALRVAIQSLEGARIEISARATEKGGLFKSIVARDVANAISEKKGVHLLIEAIQLEKPIKETGEHAIDIVSGDAKARINLAITASS
ncbi:MAG: 50S ribosomal protein L9 [bacterium]|nr:50S ribosomal protein L9 [bacterium]